MPKLILPTIPLEQRTPVVVELLKIVETLAVENQRQSETIQHLRDEIAILKGEKAKPKIKPSKLDKNTEVDEQSDGDGDGDGDGEKGNKNSTDRRAGSDKRNKTKTLKIDKWLLVQPEEPLPEGSVFKGYREFVIQDLVIDTCNTCYQLAIWQTPQGKTVSGKAAQQDHFGETLKSYVIYQHHQCQVTQPLLLEQLRQWGVDISAGQIDRILGENEPGFTAEKEALLNVGLGVSDYVTVDDSGARHQGKNGYVTHIGNSHFAWYRSTDSKSRINFLKLLRGDNDGYHLSEEAFVYMGQAKLAKPIVALLQASNTDYFSDETSWNQHLDTLGIEGTRHRRVATEAALVGNLLEHGFRDKHLVIVSDDAGQFNVFLHALCWVHTERLVHKLIPLNDQHRIEIQSVRDQIWTLYRDLKKYKKSPTADLKVELSARFDAIFSQKTSYETLNQQLKRIARNKEELLLVLERPEIVLHTNGSEADIRDYVKKKKISGGTRSEKGRRCRDTHTSLKKTCRKLGISFWEFIKDRLSGKNKIPSLPDLVRQKVLDEAVTNSY